MPVHCPPVRIFGWYLGLLLAPIVAGAAFVTVEVGSGAVTGGVAFFSTGESAVGDVFSFSTSFSAVELAVEVVVEEEEEEEVDLL